MNKEEHLGRETAAFLDIYGRIDPGEGNLLRRLSDVLAERDAAREELATLKAAQPESAPVKTCHDPIRWAEGLIEQLPKSHEGASSWLMNYGTGERARECRAQWKERMGAEAPVAEHRRAFTAQAGITVLQLLVRSGLAMSDADARRMVAQGAVFYQVDPDAMMVRIDNADFVFDIVGVWSIFAGKSKSVRVEIERSEAPVAEPAAPAQEQEGPFSVSSHGMPMLLEGGRPIPWVSKHLQRLARLLNAGLEAPKLRARVAQLERSVDFHQSAAKEIAAERDAAEMRVAELETAALSNISIESDLEKVLGSEKARADAAERRVAELEASCSHRTYFREKDRADAAEAKLAALGENPIPRALVERWFIPYPSTTSGIGWVLREILAGREPGVAS